VPDHVTRAHDQRRTGSPAAGGAPLPQADAQGRLGNAAVVDLLRDQAQSGGAQDVDTLWDIAAAHGASKAPDLRDGTRYTVRSEDLSGGEFGAWKKIARDHGLTEGLLRAFNQHVATADQGLGGEQPMSAAPQLAAGVSLYVPSSDEVLFKQIAERKQGDVAAATTEYNQLAKGHNVAMLRTARKRASGDVGASYGTAGLNGIFYSQNPALAGASEKAGRSEKVGGEKQYKINWGPNFWKCSVFLHDTVYSSGYKPDLTENKHYRLAGQLQWSKDYVEVPMKDARPGDCWQRFGGTRSDESHNAILSSYVNVVPGAAGTETWAFSIIGAETDRASDSDQRYEMKAGTNETTAGKLVRFFRPKARR
jgi:hypothetical protein